jgi:hypothetical protein
MSNHDHFHSGICATSTTSALSGFYMVWERLAEHAPPWSLLPPLLLSFASAAGAYWSGRRIRQDMVSAQERHAQELRQSEELHRARLERVRGGRDFGEGLDAEVLAIR